MLGYKHPALLIAVMFAVTFAVTGCAAPSPEDDDDEVENEPTGATEEELRSGVSCSERAVTGYRSGSPHAMKVVTVGGKPTAKATAHAFLKLQTAADSAGITLSINSGFRSMDEQRYLYNCYRNRNCNNGNLAARPGYSNHQNGQALDLATSNWTWLKNNASRFGFRATVPSERWHYEYAGSDPGGPCSGGGGSTTDDTADDDIGGDTNTPGGGCNSATLGRNVEEGACVQAQSDSIFFQCNAGKWYRGVSNGRGPYGACTSTHPL